MKRILSCVLCGLFALCSPIRSEPPDPPLVYQRFLWSVPSAPTVAVAEGLSVSWINEEKTKFRQRFFLELPGGERFIFEQVDWARRGERKILLTNDLDGPLLSLQLDHGVVADDLHGQGQAMAEAAASETGVVLELTIIGPSGCETKYPDVTFGSGGRVLQGAFWGLPASACREALTESAERHESSLRWIDGAFFPLGEDASDLPGVGFGLRAPVEVLVSLLLDGVESSPSPRPSPAARLSSTPTASDLEILERFRSVDAQSPLEWASHGSRSHEPDR